MPASTVIGTRGTPGTPGSIRNDRVWSGAGAYRVFPACEAVIVQVPGLAAVTTGPDTEHTPGVSERNETASPDDADADSLSGRPAVTPAGGRNVIACERSGPTTGSTWNDCV